MAHNGRWGVPETRHTIVDDRIPGTSFDVTIVEAFFCAEENKYIYIYYIHICVI